MHNSAPLLFRDMITVTDRLPTREECIRTWHLVIKQAKAADDDLATVLSSCPYLESLVLSGARDTTDRTIVAAARTATNLHGIDITGCERVTDVGVLELVEKSLPLQWIRLNGVVGLTDPTISSIAKSCSRLVEIELCDLPLVTALSVRDLWSFSRKLRVLRLARCPLLTDKAFPSPLAPDPFNDFCDEKPLPPNPSAWPDDIPPLVLRHTSENLRVLDLEKCERITDEAIQGIVAHAPKIQTLVLSGCSLLTDKAVASICTLGNNLDALMLAHVPNVTDPAIINLARSCSNMRTVDLSFCRQLTDMSVFELAGLSSLRELSIIRVHRLTDNAVFFLAEHATALEHLHLSYCDRVSLDAILLLLNKLTNLQTLAATGVPSFRRKGVERFSSPPPSHYGAGQQAAFRVYVGENIKLLRNFLEKEEKRRREAEAKNVPFLARSDDKLDLY